MLVDEGERDVALWLTVCFAVQINHLKAKISVKPPLATLLLRLTQPLVPFGAIFPLVSFLG